MQPRQSETRYSMVPPKQEGSFVRIRTLNFAVEYAGIRVRETTTAAETIRLVASKLRLDEGSPRTIVMVSPLATERARRGRARWRIRTLRGDEALLPLRRLAAQRIAASRVDHPPRPPAPEQAPAPSASSSYFSSSRTTTNARKTNDGASSQQRQTAPTTTGSSPSSSSTGGGLDGAAFREEVRFYLQDEASTPLDATELPENEDASGSESSDDERPPEAKFVADRQLLLAKKHAVKVGTLLKRSEHDPNLWRRRKVVLVDDRLWYWRDAVVPEAAPSLSRGEKNDAPPLEKNKALLGATTSFHQSSSLFQGGGSSFSEVTGDKATPPKRRGSDSMLASFVEGPPNNAKRAWGGPFYDPEDLEYDRLARSRAASAPLASNVVAEITGKRDVPHGIEIATASRSLVFRAENRAQQLDWLEKIREGIEIATQNEYVALAELIIADEQKRQVDADIRHFIHTHQPDWSFDFDENSQQLSLTEKRNPRRPAASDDAPPGRR
mmetsp:Transcript_15214/g.49574  ORF Transcript_15214/g.49574 Transcript_15214/m.49574 type:complete len:497 (+) Transcript_15214:92-1582(+)